MQEARMSEEHLADLMADHAKAERLSKIHHEHLGNDQVKLRGFYSGTRDRDIHAAMDADRAFLESAGATNFHRTKIGRNSTCPCGSGSKFKKCCMAGAQVITTR